MPQNGQFINEVPYWCANQKHLWKSCVKFLICNDGIPAMDQWLWEHLHLPNIVWGNCHLGLALMNCSYSSLMVFSFWLCTTLACWNSFCCWRNKFYRGKDHVTFQPYTVSESQKSCIISIQKSTDIQFFLLILWFLCINLPLLQHRWHLLWVLLSQLLPAKTPSRQSFHRYPRQITRCKANIRCRLINV